MKTALTLIVLLMIPHAAGHRPLAQEQPRGQLPEQPVLTVQGRGEVKVLPDRVRIRLGAVAQARRASAAQLQVNRVMEETLRELVQAGIPERNIRTAGLSLMPVYGERFPQRAGPPEITGYRASNVLQIDLDDVDRTGEVLDLGVSAGANQIESVAFLLEDDRAAREQALGRAIAGARNKADAMARAADLELRELREIVELEPDPVRPLEMHRLMVAEAATPVQPGEITVQASVQLRFLLSPAGAAAPRGP